MSYPLSFTDEFFFDGDPETISTSSRPTCVYQAILSLKAEAWNALAREVFSARPDALDPLTVLDRIRETNACSSLDAPVHVWIDAEGWHEVVVHEH